MLKEWHAKRRNAKTGPHATREEALAAFRAKYPFKGKDYEASAKRNQIMTGYGKYGPNFDMRWHNAM